MPIGNYAAAGASAFRKAVLGLLLLAIAAAVDAAESLNAEPTTLLIGSILDLRGQPAAGARVGILGTQQVYVQARRMRSSLSAKVDAAGRFQLAVPTSLGSVTLVARRLGSLSVKSAPIALNATRQQVPELRLPEGLKLTGRVFNEKRQPIFGATVQAVADGFTGDTIRTEPQRVLAQSGRDGSFELVGLDVGNHKLSAFGNGYALWINFRQPVADSAASRQLEIVLKKGMYLSGTVLDVQGQPLARVGISNPEAAAGFNVTSDANGRFRLGPFEAGTRVVLDAQREGYTPYRETLVAPRSDLALVLNRNATLRGRVIDAATEQPVPSIQVAIVRSHISTGGSGRDADGPRSFSSSDGRFELPNLYTGPGTIMVRARGYETWESAAFEFQGGVTHDIAVALKKGLILRGRIIEKVSGRPLAGAEVSAELKGSYEFADALRGVVPTVNSDAAGAFIVEGLPPGRVALRARIPGHRDVVEEVNAGTQAFVELAALRGAIIRGQVFASDGVAAREATVMLNQDGSGYGIGTDSQGRFEFTQREPGRYRIEAKTNNARSESQEVALVEGQEISGLVLRLTAGATVRGQLSGVAAPELATARVFATQFITDHFDRVNDLRMVRPQNTAAIEAGGDFRIQGLSSGIAWVAARTRFSSILKQVEIPKTGEATVDFDFGDVQVAGRVTRNGRPVQGAEVFASPLDGQLVSAFGITTAMGDYSLSNLARGRYSVAAYNAKAVELQVGTGLIQDFELTDSFEISGRVVDTVTGQGLAEVAVQLVPLAGSGRRLYSDGFLKTDRQGAFSLEQVTTGDYRLIMYRAGYDLAERRVPVSASVKNIAMKMRPAAGAHLRVRTADAAVIGAVHVSELLNDGVGTNVLVRLDRNGECRLPPSLAGRTLRIQHRDYEPYRVANWNGAQLDIELQVLPPR